MIELEEDENGKYVIPGPDTHGRAYRVIDPYTGLVAHNYTTCKKNGVNPDIVKMIEGYTAFDGWATELVPLAVVRAEVTRLNSLPARYESTPFTELKERILERAKTDEDLAELVKLLQRSDSDVRRAWL